MAYIILQCVKEKSKLRIRFNSFVDGEGKRYLDVYNNKYNCKFPNKDEIRKEGRYYKISDKDLKITSRQNCVPFYTVSIKEPHKSIINVLDAIDVYKIVEECVICLDSKPNITFAPCGHHITCKECYDIYRFQKNTCPLCRVTITSAIL
tara:strand:+ start:4128 stop:4574 length:447 start_codon:yes stop_codon:yes gene_type:complete